MLSPVTRPREEILEPELPIVDPHHHLWIRPKGALPPAPHHPFVAAIANVDRYLIDELIADMMSGHNVRATVFLECRAMYRADGPESLRCVGETEFVNGQAAISAGGLFGDVRACAGIIGYADLRMGAAVEDVLRSHIAAGHGRFRCIRNSASHDSDSGVLGPLAGREPGLYCDSRFR